MENSCPEWINQATKLIEDKQFDDAIKLLSNKMSDAEEKKKLDILYTLEGNAYYEKNNYDNAIASYGKAIEANKDFDLAYYNKGLIKGTKKQDGDGGINDLNLAIKLNPKNAYYHITRGSLFRQEKDYSAAIADCDAAIEIDDKNPEAYYTRANPFSIKKVST